MTCHAEEAHGVDGVGTLPGGNALIVAHLGDEAVGFGPALVIVARSHQAVVVPRLVGPVPILHIIEFTAHDAVSVMMLDKAVHHLLAVLGSHLGALGLLVDDGLSLLVKDVDGVKFKGV